MIAKTQNSFQVDMEQLVRRVIEATTQRVALVAGLREFTDSYGNKHKTDFTDNQLVNCLDNVYERETLIVLSQKDRDLALSFVAAYRVGDKWTDKQMAQVVRIVNKSNGERPTPKGSSESGITGIEILSMLQAASDNLKRPSVEFNCSSLERVSHNGIVRFQMTTRGRNKGSVAIVSDGGYGNNDFYGYIRENGEVSLRGKGFSNKEWITQLMKLLETDLHGMIELYGAKSGKCCFCRKTLTDRKSVAAGFGKTCANNYGLSDEYRAAR